MKPTNNGWIKVHRNILNNPAVMKDSDHFAIWMYLLLNATHEKYDIMWCGKRRTLVPGQLVTSRRKISKELVVSESKVDRILKLFEIEHQIEQLTTSRSRLISLINWTEYQKSEPLNEPLVNHYRTTSEPLVNTNKNIKNNKNERNNIIKPNRFNSGCGSRDYDFGEIEKRMMEDEQ